MRKLIGSLLLGFCFALSPPAEAGSSAFDPVSFDNEVLSPDMGTVDGYLCEHEGAYVSSWPNELTLNDEPVDTELPEIDESLAFLTPCCRQVLLTEDYLSEFSNNDIQAILEKPVIDHYRRMNLFWPLC